MFGRAVVVWALIVPLAIANGMLRELLLVPFLGDVVARAVSCFTLSGAVLFVAWMSLAWIGPSTPSAAWRVGAIWLALTLTFEFLAGHYVFGTSWQALLAEYNIFAGRLWMLVLITTVAAPPLMFLAVHSPATGGNVSPAR